MTAYYSEKDKFAAAWLRELIAEKLIAPGEVDERDIQDVTPNELRPFRQVHLFAGIGIWSASMRGAGWPDDREVWTVSCPCQPFSAAGQRTGFADERHLWPSAYHLIGQRCPPVVFGEQSSSKDGLAWFDLVSADMEAADYSGGPLDLCSAGFGAPNIRQRNYFVWLADAHEPGWQGRAGVPERASECAAGSHGLAVRLADTGCERSSRRRELRDMGSAPDSDEGSRGKRQRLWDAANDSNSACGMAYANGGDAGTERLQRGGEHGQRSQDAGDSPGSVPGPANGFWRDADWILCRDPDGPKWRPVAPGSFPLVAGHPNRMALLRGAGNALNKEVAQGFIEAVLAIVDTHAKRGDAPQIAAPFMSGGGAEGNRPDSSSSQTG